MKLIELIEESHTQKLSPSKLWFNIGHCALVFAFVWNVTHYELKSDTMLIFGGLVCGSRFADKYLNFKGNTNGSTSS